MVLTRLTSWKRRSALSSFQSSLNVPDLWSLPERTHTHIMQLYVPSALHLISFPSSLACLKQGGAAETRLWVLWQRRRLLLFTVFSTQDRKALMGHSCSLQHFPRSIWRKRGTWFPVQKKKKIKLLIIACPSNLFWGVCVCVCVCVCVF